MNNLIAELDKLRNKVPNIYSNILITIIWGNIDDYAPAIIILLKRLINQEICCVAFKIY